MNITKGVRDQIPKSVRVHPKNWQEISDTKKILFKKKNTNIDVSDNHCQPRMYGVSKTSQELSGNKDCREFRFSFVRIVISVSNVTSLWDCFCHCVCHCLCLCICLCHCIFVGQVMSPHHSDQMSQTSQVCRVILLLCFQKVSQSVSESVSQ